MRNIFVSSLILLALLVSSCHQQTGNQIFNGRNLDGWNFVLEGEEKHSKTLRSNSNGAGQAVKATAEFL